MPLQYPVNAPKAASIVVIFKSTAHPNGATKDYIKLPGFAAGKGTEVIGGQLYIDDINLTY